MHRGVFNREQHTFGIFGLFLHIKGVHNLKTKSSSIILTPWAMFVPISAFLLFLVSEVACAE